MRKIHILIEKSLMRKSSLVLFSTVITVMKTLTSQRVFRGGYFLRF